MIVAVNDSFVVPITTTMKITGLAKRGAATPKAEVDLIREAIAGRDRGRERTKAMTVIEKSSGNVFADIGIPAPETHALKAALVHRISALIKRENMTQADAAERMGISQPDVSKMLRGQFRPFSLERLMRFLNALGQDVEIAVRAPKRRRRGKLSVQAA
jgi:predicted XRE-type DNA-binding protein